MLLQFAASYYSRRSQDYLSQLKYLGLLSCSVVLLSSCNGATFHGGNPQTASRSKVDQGTSMCSVTPRSAALGQEVTVSVDFDGANLEQVVSGPESFVPVTTKLTNGSVGWTAGDGVANTLQPTAVGRYTITLATPASEGNVGPGNELGRCEFEVVSESTTPSLDPNIDSEICKEHEVATGAHLAFLIDNSNSNATTDCPGARRVSQFNNSEVFECGGQTNREKAVLAAFDTLTAVGQRYRNADATSSLAVASFPTQTNFISGYQNETTGSLATVAAKRQDLANALSFARRPFGLTPYGGAMSAAQDIFAGTPSDNKSRVAVLVTDGEPTDQNAAAVEAQARELEKFGVEIITVFITGAQTRTQRTLAHQEMLRQVNERQRTRGQGNWFDDNAHHDFPAYIDALVGGTGRPGLAARISSNRDRNCAARDGNCSKQIVEVADASSLQAVFQSIVKTKAVKCN